MGPSLELIFLPYIQWQYLQQSLSFAHTAFELRMNLELILLHLRPCPEK